MRRFVGLVTAVVMAGVVVGCGDRSLILKINILSFLDSSQSSVSYSVPGALPNVTVDVVDQQVNLLPAIDDATDVVSATLDVAVSFDNQTGTATGSLLFYAVPDDTTPVFSSTPI